MNLLLREKLPVILQEFFWDVKTLLQRLTSDYQKIWVYIKNNLKKSAV